MFDSFFIVREVKAILDSAFSALAPYPLFEGLFYLGFPTLLFLIALGFLDGAIKSKSIHLSIVLYAVTAVFLLLSIFVFSYT